MIDLKLKYQAAIFVDAIEIAPTPSNLTHFINSFSDYSLIPSTFQEVVNNDIVSRFNLSSLDGMWSIEFGTNRIDIQKIPIGVPGNDYESEINEFCKAVIKFYQIIELKIENLKVLESSKEKKKKRKKFLC